MSRAWYDDISLPPILLYQVGDIYFVVDGTPSRVGRARAGPGISSTPRCANAASRCRSRVDLLPEDLEVLGAKVRFLERTNLDRLRPAAELTATVLGGYERMLEHIAVHRYFMGLDFQRDVSENEAVEHWYDTVYLPVVQVVDDSGVMRAFPKRTEADFYLWVMDHRHYLVAQGQADLVEPGRAAEEFVRHYLSGQIPPAVDGPIK